MSKLDRSILIFIGLGIWTLALNYVFELTSSRADIDSNCKDDQNPCFVSLVSLYKNDDGSYRSRRGSVCTPTNYPFVVAVRAF